MSTKFKVDTTGADVNISGRDVTIKGKHGEAQVKIEYPFLLVEKMSDILLHITAEKDIAYQKAIAGTLAANIKNAVKGVNEGYTAELELVYQHFPATMKVVGEKLIVENFVGERKPREVKLIKGVNVKIDGNKIKINGTDKYKVGQTAGTIEARIQIKSLDRRVFKDGVYITKKP